MKVRVMSPLLFAAYGMAMIVGTQLALKDYRSLIKEVIRSQDYPTVIGALLVVCAIWHFFAMLKESKKAVANQTEVDGYSLKDMPLKVILVMVSLFVFIVCAIEVGYYISTFFFAGICEYMIDDRKKPLISLAFSVVTTVVLYGMFTLMHVYFPTALLF